MGEEYVEMPQKTRGELSITVTAKKNVFDRVVLRSYYQ